MENEEIQKDDTILNSPSQTTQGQYLTEREMLDIVIRLKEHTETIFIIQDQTD
jgi:hypothetical protein